VINVISKYIIAVVVRLRPTPILFVHGPCGSSLLRSNLKYFYVDCLIFRRWLAFVYPDFSVQIPCYTALHSTFYDYLVYGTCWTAGLRCSAVFLAVLEWSAVRSAVVCGFQAYRVHFPKFSPWCFFLTHIVLHLHNKCDTACSANSPLLDPHLPGYHTYVWRHTINNRKNPYPVYIHITLNKQ